MAWSLDYDSILLLRLRLSSQSFIKFDIGFRRYIEYKYKRSRSEEDN